MPTSLREAASDAVRFWEPRRIIYNLLLAVVVIGYFVRGLPSSRSQISLDFLLFLFLLAVLANVAYCAAYVVDVFAQATELRGLWLKYRWILFAVGVSFAAVITRFFAVGFFLPGSR